MMKIEPVLELVNSAVNVCSNLFGRFEVIPYDPPMGSPSSFFAFFQHEQKSLPDSLFLPCEFLFIRLRL